MATASAVTDVGWLAWRDPRAWMETMRGPRWTALVKRENEAFDAAVRCIAGKEEVEAAVSQFEAAAEEGDVIRRWQVDVPGTPGIRVISHGSAGIVWSWEGESEKGVVAGDLAVGSAGSIAYTRDFGKGAESYEIIVQRGTKHLWRSRGEGGKGYGPTVAILKDYVIALEADDPLNYSRLVAVHLGTKERHVVYEEPAHSIWMLSLVKGERGCLFLVAEHAGRQKLFFLEGGELQLRQVSPEGISFYPIGYVEGGEEGKQEPSYFVRRGAFSAPWELHGPLARRWRIPNLFLGCGIELAIASLGLVIWKQDGERIVWTVGRHGSHPRLLGEFAMNPWARWVGRSMKHECIVTVPGATPVQMTLEKGGDIHLSHPLSEYGGRRQTGFAVSVDGVRVRWVCLQNANRREGIRPAGLLISAYGAYGIPTGLDTGRWKPYLERGWAIGIAFVRGGGDANEAWAEAGRREGKLRGVEDLEACIRALQKITEVGANETVLFGRSAGGYLAGAAVVRHPRGELFRTAYVEVPYVDVLRTAGNPSLPLTAYEYLEFGDPSHRLADFEFLLHHSPISGLGPEGAPGVRVICRTSLNDKQVYAYESAKWVDVLRGKGGGLPKWLAFQSNAGHFLQGAPQAIQRAEDFLLLTK